MVRTRFDLSVSRMLEAGEEEVMLSDEGQEQTGVKYQKILQLQLLQYVVSNSPRVKSYVSHSNIVPICWQIFALIDRVDIFTRKNYAGCCRKASSWIIFTFRYLDIVN